MFEELARGGMGVVYRARQASGSEDDAVKLWSVASQLKVGSLKFGDHVRQVGFPPDENRLAVVTDRGTLRLIHAASLRQADLELEASAP